MAFIICGKYGFIQGSPPVNLNILPCFISSATLFLYSPNDFKLGVISLSPCLQNEHLKLHILFASACEFLVSKFKSLSIHLGAKKLAPILTSISVSSVKSYIFPLHIISFILYLKVILLKIF